MILHIQQRTKQPLQQRIIQSEIPVMLRLRNPIKPKVLDSEIVRSIFNLPVHLARFLISVSVSSSGKKKDNICFISFQLAQFLTHGVVITTNNNNMKCQKLLEW